MEGQARSRGYEEFIPRKASQGPALFQSHFSLILLNPERNRGGTRKGISFGQERLIINMAGKLGFRRAGFHP